MQQRFLLCLVCRMLLQTGHITLSSTPDQQLENHSRKYHRHQPLYNTLELLMMGIVVPETVIFHQDLNRARSNIKNYTNEAMDDRKCVSCSHWLSFKTLVLIRFCFFEHSSFEAVDLIGRTHDRGALGFAVY